MVRLLSSADVAMLITMADIVPAVEAVFKEHALHKVVMPCKIYLDVDGYGDFRAMPAYIPSSKTAGIKWVNVHPGNPGYNKPTVMASILLNNPNTGELMAIMDGTFITDMRTGCAGALAAKHLARKDAAVIGLIGSGRQAWTQMLGYQAVYGDQIKLVKVYSIDLNQSREFAATVRNELGYETVVCEDPKEAANADIVVTTTPSRKPVVMTEWIKPGTHINAIGADAPGKQELETQLTVTSRVFIDSLDQASHSGEINVPWSKGLLSDDGIAGTIGEVIAGTKAGRQNDKEITIFDSTGLSIQDMAVAHIVYERALLDGAGKEFDMLRGSAEAGHGKQNLPANAKKHTLKA